VSSGKLAAFVDFVLPWGQGEIVDRDDPQTEHFAYADGGLRFPEHARRAESRTLFCDISVTANPAAQ